MKLTDRDREILRLRAIGMTGNQIRARLGLKNRGTTCCPLRKEGGREMLEMLHTMRDMEVIRQKVALDIRNALQSDAKETKIEEYVREGTRQKYTRATHKRRPKKR